LTSSASSPTRRLWIRRPSGCIATCTFYGTHALYDHCNGVVLDETEGKRVAAALGPNKAVILQNQPDLLD
jgi:hypothetical protein